jgi:hypothetical protein
MRLSAISHDALRDLLAVSWRLTLPKVRQTRRKPLTTYPLPIVPRR